MFEALFMVGSGLILIGIIRFIIRQRAGTLTLKSDWKNSDKIISQNSKKTITKLVNYSNILEEKDKKNFIYTPNVIELPSEIDMTGVTGIRLEGSTSAFITEDTITVDKGSSLKVSKSTLLIRNNSDVSSNEKIHIPLNHFTYQLIDRISLKGSGDLKLANLEFLVEEVDVILKGSGDIKIKSSVFNNLLIYVSGSGDILVDENCVIHENIYMTLKGSGDITVATNQFNNSNTKIDGSGDINIKTFNNSSKQSIEFVS